MKQLLVTTIAALVLVGCGFGVNKPLMVLVGSRSSLSIHEAASDGNIEAVKEDITGGADVNTINEWGGTPLHYATVSGHKEIAELLIIKGANVNAKLATDETPLDNAINHGHPETANLLRKHGGKTGAELRAAGN